MKNILYTIILSFLFSSAVSAEIYKWVDDEGKVHYGEKLPDNTKGKSIENIKTKDSVSADYQAGFEAYEAGDYATALKIYRAAAEQGDIMAQFTLGQIYTRPGKYKKHGVTKDYKEAVKWRLLAAEQGEDIVQFMLGLMYKKGEGVTRNLVIAHMWFNTATFSNVEAYTASWSAIKNKRFLKNYRKQKKKEVERLESEMTPEQIAKAKELARECIKKNYKDCVNSSLNIEKAPNKTTDKTVETIKTKDSVSADIQASEDAYEAGDYEAAFILIKLLAEQGDPWAQYKIGQMYDEGKGVTQDYKEAVKWYHLAAEQGDADAQNSLGYMYQNGEGVTKDYKEAEKWYRLATKQGDAGAQFNLGVMYQAGYGVTKDYQEALKWFRLAAEQGLAESQFNLGQMYVKGQGVTQDYKEATKWWRLAAEQGDVEAQYNLGVMYSQGEGPTQDYKEAAKWYRLAAAQGFVEAQYNLAVMYVFGQGVIKNHVVAHMWTNIAARNGHEAAKKSIDFLAKKMKPKQIAKAKELARFCVRKNYKNCNNFSLSIEKAEALEANAKAKEKAKELKRKPNKAIDNFRSFKTECIKTKYKSEDCKRQFPDASSNIEKSP